MIYGIILIKARDQALVVNDDFCDDLELGSDESRTAACSGVPGSAVRFMCGKDNSTSIPMSRVGDGVCDCCDGTDEKPHGDGKSSCPDVCAKLEMTAKMEALEWHRFVQQGVRKKQEMVNSMRRKKTREGKTLENLRHDLKNVKKVQLDLRYWLRREESKESPKHFQLLRDRELRCISGQGEFCDYWQSKFLAKDELWIENAPDGYMDSIRNRVRKPRTQRELEYRATLSSFERVRSSLCNASDIIPDESLRVHTTVGDYLSFQETPGGTSSRKLTANQQRKQTFFVRFLEGGPKGPVYLLLFLGETLSLVISPVVMPLYGVAVAMERGVDMAVDAISECAATAAPHNTENSSNTNRASPYPAVVSQACLVLNQTRVPGTAAFEVASFFDYTSYSVPMYLLDNYISPFLKIPYMVARLMYRAPITYYEYYVGRRFLDLPPSRNSCLLRTALEVAEEESVMLRRRIKEENDMLLSLAAAEEDMGGKALLGDMMTQEEADKEIDLDNVWVTDAAKRPSIYNFFSTRFAKRTREATKAGLRRRNRLVDFGPTGELEALKNLCITSSGNTGQGGGQGDAGGLGVGVELCFYKYVSFDNRLLGRWFDWGPFPDLDPSNNATAATETSTYEVKDGVVTERVQPLPPKTTLAWLGGLASAMRGVKVDQYEMHLKEKRKTRGYWNHQMYTEGAPCDGTIISGAVVADAATPVSVEMELISARVDEDELTMTSAGVVRKRDLATVSADDEGKEKREGDDSKSTGIPVEALPVPSSTRRRVQVDLTCGVSTEIDAVRPSESDVCVTIVSVSTPLACTPDVEKDSLDALDRLGVFGFTKSKRKTAEQAQENVLLAAEERKRASAQKQAERHSKAAEQQKIRETEAFRAADLERKKKALGSVGKKKEKKEKQEKKKKKEIGDKKKKKKTKSKGLEQELEEQEAAMRQNRERETKQRTSDRQALGGSVDLDVVEPAILETDADVFDSLPDDEEENEEVISLDGVTSMMEGKKLVGGILRPEDLPIGNT